MEISKAAAGVLAAICVTVGAGAAYLGTGGKEPVSLTTGTNSGSISPDPSVATVEQSEAIIRDLPSELPATSLSPAPRAVAPRTSARTRQAPVPANRSTRPEPVAAPTVSPLRDDAPLLTVPAIEPVRAPEPDRVRAIEPARPEFEELVVDANSVVGLEVDTSISSERAQVEDEVVGHVTRDVRVGDRVAIPAGSKVHGEVTLVERGGRVRERARLGVRFTSVVLADGTRVPLETETIFREGDAPGGESAAKIGGGAIGGAIIGGILGGAKGAVIGGSVGAGAGTTAVMIGGRNPATLPTGTPVTVRVVKPTTVTVEK